MLRQILQLGNGHFEATVVPPKAPIHHVVLRLIGLILGPGVILFAASLFGTAVLDGAGDVMRKPNGVDILITVGFALVPAALAFLGLRLLYKLGGLWVWYLFSKEVIRVDENGLSLTRHYFTFSKTQQFSQSQVKGIMFRPKSPNWVTRYKHNTRSRLMPIYYGDYLLQANDNTEIRFGSILTVEERSRLTPHIAKFHAVGGSWQKKNTF